MRRLALSLVFIFLAAGCSSSSPQDDATTPPTTSTATDVPSPGPGLPDEPTTTSGNPAETPRTEPEHGAPMPPPVPDATAPGSLQWKRANYDFGTMVVTDPTMTPYQYPVKVTGSLTYPDGAGPYPLVLLMHGRHGTCDVAGTELIFVPCANAVVVTPVDSFTGYDYLSENLASHGYVVASANANEINDKDVVGDSGANARAQLVLNTLLRLEELNATGTTTAVAGVAMAELKGRIDVSRIGLMGHSRGGEGVVRAITLNEETGSKHAIRAVFALAPTDFRRWSVANVAFATLLPYCDGDVSNLQGAWMYDDARAVKETKSSPKFQVLAMGADHNFYNTVWTGDDWSAADPWCGNALPNGGRDTAALQRKHGLGLMASFFRLYVGGDAPFAQVWDGEIGMPGWLCGKTACDDRLHLSRQPSSGDRAILDDDGSHGTAAGFADRTKCTPAGCPGTPTIGTASQTSLTWTSEASVTYSVAKQTEPWKAVTFRIGVPTGKPAPHIDVVLVDANGVEASAPAPAAALYEPPGGTAADKTVLNMARVPLSAFEGIDTTSLAQVRLVFHGTGAAQINDVMMQR